MDVNRLNTSGINNAPEKPATLSRGEIRRENSESVSIGNGKEPVKLNILHMNDIHGAVEPFFDPSVSEEADVGGLANAKAMIDGEREKNPEGTILTYSGDFTDGSYVSDKVKGAAVADAMGEMDFDAVGLGNHDFCWGTTRLKTLMSRIDAPIVAANIIEGDGKTLDGAQPYIIKDIKGVKVGIIGIDMPTTGKQLTPEQRGEIQFLDSAGTMKKFLPEMKKKGADVLIALTHLGLGYDRKLAQSFPEESLVIVGGHTHSNLAEVQREGKSIIVQAGSMSRYLGNLELQFDPAAKKITDARETLIPVIEGKVKPDMNVSRIVERYSNALNKTGANQLMGLAAENLDYSNHAAAKLNQIQADSMLEGSGADFAISYSSCLRRHVKAGPVTRKELYDAFPFGEWEADTIKTSGQSVKDLLEKYLIGESRILVPAGLSYQYDPSQPDGKKLTGITLPDGSPLDPKKEYTVILNTELAHKPMFEDAQVLKKHQKIQEAFFNYFSTHTPEGGWRNDGDGRIGRV